MWAISVAFFMQNKVNSRDTHKKIRGYYYIKFIIGMITLT